MHPQEFIHPPLLIDGRKFDVTVHIDITSVKPLRIYVKDSYIMRVASEKYEPFDVNKMAANIVADQGTSRYQYRPSLRPFMKEGATHRDILGMHFEPEVVF